ncbi:hypothetical protein [Paraburkholderia graminis]
MKNVKLEKLKAEIIPLMTRISELESNGRTLHAWTHLERAEQQFELTTSIQRLDALTALYQRLMNADLQ